MNSIHGFVELTVPLFVIVTGLLAWLTQLEEKLLRPGTPPAPAALGRSRRALAARVRGIRRRISRPAWTAGKQPALAAQQAVAEPEGPGPVA